ASRRVHPAGASPAARYTRRESALKVRITVVFKPRLVQSAPLWKRIGIEPQQVATLYQTRPRHRTEFDFVWTNHQLEPQLPVSPVEVLEAHGPFVHQFIPEL